MKNVNELSRKCIEKAKKKYENLFKTSEKLQVYEVQTTEFVTSVKAFSLANAEIIGKTLVKDYNKGKWNNSHCSNIPTKTKYLKTTLLTLNIEENAKV
jgi:hypothetical protein